MPLEVIASVLNQSPDDLLNIFIEAELLSIICKPLCPSYFDQTLVFNRGFNQK